MTAAVFSLPTRVARTGLLAGMLAVLGLTLGACNSSKQPERASVQPQEAGAARASGAPTVPFTPPPTAGTAAAAAPPAAPAEATSVRIGAWLTQAKEMDFGVKPEALLTQFIREFNDGTVVDKVMVAPAQDGPRGKPTFYLVGMGQRNGQFRAMALPLDQSPDDGGLYLSPRTARHVAEGTNCVMCYFRFSRGNVTGVDCSEASTGAVERSCNYRTLPGNGFFTKK